MVSVGEASLTITHPEGASLPTFPLAHSYSAYSALLVALLVALVATLLAFCCLFAQARS